VAPFIYVGGQMTQKGFHTAMILRFNVDHPQRTYHVVTQHGDCAEHQFCVAHEYRVNLFDARNHTTLSRAINYSAIFALFRDLVALNFAVCH